MVKGAITTNYKKPIRPQSAQVMNKRQSEGRPIFQAGLNSAVYDTGYESNQIV